MQKTIIIFCLLVLSIGCSNSKKVFKPSEKLTMLFLMLEGEYNSTEQAAKDSNFLDISWIVKRIWNNRTDGYWLYVEQAISNKKDKPYRQRVYQLIQKGDNTFVGRIYQFNDPLTYAGAHMDDAKMALLSFDKLTTKASCDLVLNKYGSVFEGGTVGKSCPSSLKGSVYATSEIIIEQSVLKYTERGYNEENKQVWGQEHGPYLFKKLHAPELNKSIKYETPNTR